MSNNPSPAKKGERFDSMLAKWSLEQQGKDAKKFDFLNNPGQLDKFRDDNRQTALEEWQNLSLQTKAWSILQQFFTSRRVYYASDSNEEDVPFMLKSKRLEYIFEFFRSQLEQPTYDIRLMSLKERADLNFVNDLRFQMARMFSNSMLIGANVCAFSYFLLWRHLKLYVGIPLTFMSFFLTRNLVMKSCVNNFYYPLEPLYKEVRKHRTVSKDTPEGAKGVRDIQRVAQ